MGAAGYLGRLREYVGHDLLLSPAVAACIRDEEGRILLLYSMKRSAWWRRRLHPGRGGTHSASAAQ
jgi:hypothetical protein